MPTKISFCIWLLIRDKILTQRNLQKRGYALASRCAMCSKASEDVDHLFVGCPLASKVWAALAGSFFDYQRQSVKEFFALWEQFGVTEHGRVLARFLPHAVCWTLWKERNKRIFDGNASTLHQITCAAIELSWGWYLGAMVKNKLSLDRVIFEWNTL